MKGVAAEEEKTLQMHQTTRMNGVKSNNTFYFNIADTARVCAVITRQQGDSVRFAQDTRDYIARCSAKLVSKPEVGPTIDVHLNIVHVRRRRCRGMERRRLRHDGSVDSVRQ